MKFQTSDVIMPNWIVGAILETNEQRSKIVDDNGNIRWVDNGDCKALPTAPGEQGYKGDIHSQEE